MKYDFGGIEMRLFRASTHMRIVLLYLIFAALWISITDYLVLTLAKSVEVTIRLEQSKEVIFVLVTALLLYFERRKSDMDRRRDEQRFRIMAEFTYDWEYWLGPNGSFRYVSPSCERITGYRAEEFEADPELLNRIIHPEDLGIMTEHTEAERSEKEPASVEFRIINREGEVRWVGHVCQRVFDERSNPLGVRVSNRDLTEQKELQEKERLQIEELAHADKMITLGTLVAGVAHEINNPTNFITLNTPLIRESWKGASPILDEHYKREGEYYIGRFKYSILRERMNGLLDGVAEGANRIKRIVSSLKDYARPDPSDMNQMVDINQVIQNAVTLMSNPIKKATNHFHTDLDESIPRSIGSSQKLEQVMINLIQNSLDSLADQEKVVSVSSRFDKENRNIIVEVADEGCGIEQELLLRIVDPFFTTKRSSGGTGLGLPIADRIIKDHGGSLTFSSVVSVGTTARVVIKASE
jgi:PAS domain S-box-containing protein